jgi:hypothetical protein
MSKDCWDSMRCHRVFYQVQIIFKGCDDPMDGLCCFNTPDFASSSFEEVIDIDENRKVEYTRDAKRISDRFLC